MAYGTVQFHWGGLMGEPEDRLVHIEQDTSGRTLCGRELHSKIGPGFSRGGGYSDVTVPCPDCAAAKGYGPVHGLNARVFELAAGPSRG